MSNFRRSLFVKVISVVVICAFIVLDVTWAYPIDQVAKDNLAVESPFQARMMSEYGERFQRSSFARINLSKTVLSVAQYLYGDEALGLRPKDIETLEGVLAPELGERSRGVDLSEVSFDDGVVTLYYRISGKTHKIVVAQKGVVGEKALLGYDWIANDKYVVKIVPDATVSLEKSEEPKVHVTEEIAVLPAETEESENVIKGDISFKAIAHYLPSTGRFLTLTLLLSMFLTMATSNVVAEDSAPKKNPPVPEQVEELDRASALKRDMKIVERLINKRREHTQVAVQEEVAAYASAYEEVFQLILSNLKDPKPDIRRLSAEAIGRMSDRGRDSREDAVAPLVAAMFKEGNHYALQKMIKGLGYLSYEASSEALLKILTEFEDGTRKRGDLYKYLILEAMSFHRKSEFFSIFERYSDCDNSLETRSALQGLYYLWQEGDDRVLDVLVGAMESENPEVPRLVLETVNRMEKDGGNMTRQMAVDTVAVKLAEKFVKNDLYADKGFSPKQARSVMYISATILERRGDYTHIPMLEEERDNGVLKHGAISSAIDKIAGRTDASSVLRDLNAAKQSGDEVNVERLKRTLWLVDRDVYRQWRNDNGLWDLDRFFWGTLKCIGVGFVALIAAFVVILKFDLFNAEKKDAEAEREVYGKASDQDKAKRLDAGKETEEPVSKVVERALETVKPVEPAALISEKADPNNNRARLEMAANDIVAYLNEFVAGEDSGVRILEVDRKGHTIIMMNEIKAHIAAYEQAVENLPEGEQVPWSIVESYEFIKKNLIKLEPDAYRTGLMVLARQARRKGKDLIIALETNWMPGMERGTPQHGLINPMLKEIKSFAGELGNMGFDDLSNIVIIHETPETIIDEIMRNIGAETEDMSNLLFMGSDDIVAQFVGMSHAMRIKDVDKKPFLAAVDPSEIVKHAGDGSLSELYSSQMFEMVILMIELAYGKGAIPDGGSPLIRAYNPQNRFVEFLPRPEVLTTKTHDLYQQRLRFLQSL